MIFLFLSMNLWATDVMIQGPGVSDIEYEKNLMNHPDRISFIKHALSTPQNKNSSVIERLKKAQFHFLKGSIEKSKYYFQEIAEQRFLNSWNEKNRKIIHYSLLRLSQLSSDKTQRTLWLKKAYQYQPHIPVDKKLFSPKFIKQYQQISSQMPTQIFSLPENSKFFKKILINGEPLASTSQFVRSPGGKLRLSFYSNQYLPVHLTTQAEKLEVLKLGLTPLASGDCQQPLFHKSIQSENNFIFHTKHCESPAISQNKSIIPPTKPLPKVESPNQSRFYKKTWFWVGVSVIASGLAWQQYNQSRSSSAPIPKKPLFRPSQKEISNR